MNFEIFLLGLLIVSTLTGLFTEAIKAWLQERGKKYYSNALAGDRKSTRLNSSH